jgi:hypothetical protein
MIYTQNQNSSTNPTLLPYYPEPNSSVPVHSLRLTRQLVTTKFLMPRISLRLLQIKPIQIQMATTPTELAAIPRTRKFTLAITHIRRRPTTRSNIQSITTPALTPILDAGILVHPAV